MIAGSFIEKDDDRVGTFSIRNIVDSVKHFPTLYDLYKQGLIAILRQ